MNRRAFIGGATVGLLAAPHAILAQPATRKVARIGILGLATTAELIGPHPKSRSTDAFLRGLRELGYVYGEHFVTEARGAEARPERFPALVADLIRLRVDVIVATGPALPALKQATSTISVVMAASADPVAHGFVQSLGRPGGNFTGLSLQSVETTGKRLELLKELVPGAGMVGVLWSRSNLLNWQAAGEIEAAFKTATAARAGALLVFAAGVLYAHPASRGAGGPESPPGPLRAPPVRRGRRAQALGLSIPPSLRLRADEVLQ